MQPEQAPFWQRAYRRLLRFFPADFRWDYGGEMEDMFAQQYATALHQGGRMTTARLTNMFGLLGVEPILGRTFSEEEGVSGRDQVVVLSEGFWRRYLDADPAALGRALHLDDVPYQVIGVMPGSADLGNLCGVNTSMCPEVQLSFAFSASETF